MDSSQEGRVDNLSPSFLLTLPTTPHTPSTSSARDSISGVRAAMTLSYSLCHRLSATPLREDTG